MINDVQIEQVQKAIEALSKSNLNALSITLLHNLRQSKDNDEKRKWIVLFYSQAFQMLSFIGMALNENPNFDRELANLMEKKIKTL